jgi:hypothetical protein
VLAEHASRDTDPPDCTVITSWGVTVNAALNWGICSGVRVAGCLAFLALGLLSWSLLGA